MSRAKIRDLKTKCNKCKIGVMVSRYPHNQNPRIYTCCNCGKAIKVRENENQPQT